MKQSIFDMMDTSTYTREQLLQMLQMFYALLQQREVTVHVRPIEAPPASFVIAPPPVGPAWHGGTGDPIPQGGNTVCTGDA